MKYYIVHTQKSDTGEKHEKWIPSAHYQLSAEFLLKQMEIKPDGFDFLVAPFILTLCAGLEANLNDWLIVDTFVKHGLEHYKTLVEGYKAISFAKKLRVVVAVLTDNAFQLRENSPVVQRLDKLIAARNKITHPLAHYHIKSRRESRGKIKGNKLIDHPLHTLTVKECRSYFEAVTQFDLKFFKQYDNGYVVENEIIRELQKIVKQVSKK